MLLLRSTGFEASGLSRDLGDSRSVEGDSALPVDNRCRFEGGGEGEGSCLFIGGDSDGDSWGEAAAVGAIVL